jgi:tRNA-modifying protein YgfZ
MPVSDGVRALEEGRAFVELTGWREVAAVGGDAVTWLNDLVTNRVDDIGPNELRRTLFLDRTGRIRADVHVHTVGYDTANPDGLAVFQDPAQPKPIEDLLAPYVLSSDVELRPRSVGMGLVAVHSGISAVQFMDWPGPHDRIGYRPAMPGEWDQGVAALRSSKLTEASPQDAEVYRIRRGVPRFGIDFGDDALPSEVGWDSLVDSTKGCFLGQESVAKIRNLGHPRRLFLPFRGDGEVLPMAPILSGDEEVGRITSVAPADDGGTACIGHIRWEAREAALTIASGVALDQSN